VVQLSVPVIAAIGGVVLLAEPVSLRLVLSALAVLGGVALALRRPIARIGTYSGVDGRNG
jgi:drug/metabolite transporter (DMT)-like permease